MRITGGQLKGRIIQCPDGIIRPSMDKMRESCFAVLGDISGKSFLDLFSGSAVIAIEAVSRGAARTALCEKDKLKIRTVLKNVSITEKEMGIKIDCHFMAAELFLKRTKDRFDIVFCDPPFPYKFHRRLIESIAERAEKDSSVLQNNAYVLLHRPSEINMPDKIGVLTKTDRRVYGRSIVDFYKKTFD